jgi:hypothetical protein
VIAQEAGGFVTGSKDVPHDGVVTEAILTGRRYLVIRGVAGTPVRTVRLRPTMHAAHMYVAFSCRAGREQPRRTEAPRAGIL